jgi:DNA-binding transcriptional MerR regulator
MGKAMPQEQEPNGQDPRQESRRGKSEAAFRTISEVADDLEVPQHVLRFWETKFNQIRPMKRGGGRRYYRPEDVALLRRIRGLLYDDGFTIKGVQKLLREGAVKAGPVGEDAPPPPKAADLIAAVENRAALGGLDARTRAVLGEVIGELTEIRTLLNKQV